MQVEWTDAEVTQHSRSGHDEHARVFQSAERSDPFDELPWYADRESSNQPDYRIVLTSRRSRSRCPEPIRHLERGDAICPRHRLGRRANALDFRGWDESMRVLDDGLEREFIAQVARSKVAKEGDGL